MFEKSKNGMGLKIKMVLGVDLWTGVRLGLRVGLALGLTLDMGIRVRVGRDQLHLPQSFQNPSWPPLPVTHI